MKPTNSQGITMAWGSRAFKKTPPTPIALAKLKPPDANLLALIYLTIIFLTNDFFEFGFVFGGAAGAGLGGEDARGFGLANAIAGVGFDRLGGGKRGWLAFRHGKDEYGRD